MKRENENKKSGFTKWGKTFALICLLLAAVCFFKPMLDKSGALNAVGEKGVSDMQCAATAVSYCYGEKMQALSAEPQNNGDYKQISGLLRAFCDDKGYNGAYIVYKDGKSYRILADGAYRDNAKAGSDYFSAGDEFSLKDGYKPLKSLLERVLSGKSTGGYTTGLVKTASLKEVAMISLPLYGDSREPAAALCVEIDPGNTSYHLFMGLNLYYAGAVFLAVFMLLAAALYIAGKKRTADAVNADVKPKAGKTRPSGNAGEGKDTGGEAVSEKAGFGKKLKKLASALQADDEDDGGLVDIVAQDIARAEEEKNECTDETGGDSEK